MMTKFTFSAAVTPLSRVLLLTALAVTAQATTIFNFDADTPGTTTSFTNTVGGLSATFSSPADPGGFEIQPTIFQTLTGNVLGDPGPGLANNIALTVTFSQTLTAITSLFATADFGDPSPFTVTAFRGSTQVGSATAFGLTPAGLLFPEGQITYTGAAFDRVVFSSTAADFAIDQVAATTAPEPRVYWLIGFGLVAIGASRRWRKLQVSSK